MARQVALLRGVNIASRNRIAMADLREVVEGLGYADVKTLLMSGNAVFSSTDRPDAAAAKIRAALKKQLGLDVGVLGRSCAEMARIVDRNPLHGKATNPKRYSVVFLSGKPDARVLREVDAAKYEPELFEAHGKEIYAWWPDGLRQARLTHAFWERRLGLTATARNWNTVEKLLAMASE
jgi:uncharacterized protein (DUF1697 family)